MSTHFTYLTHFIMSYTYVPYKATLELATKVVSHWDAHPKLFADAGMSRTDFLSAREQATAAQTRYDNARAMLHRKQEQAKQKCHEQLNAARDARNKTLYDLQVDFEKVGKARTTALQALSRVSRGIKLRVQSHAVLDNEPSNDDLERHF